MRALSLLLPIAVFAQTAAIESDRAVDFSKFHTFAIRDAEFTIKHVRMDSEPVRARLNAEIRKELEGKGLRFADAGKADIDIRYSLHTEETSRITRSASRARDRVDRDGRVRYSEAKLLIALRDTSTGSLLWRAYAKAEEKQNYAGRTSASLMELKLDQMVRKSFAKYPVKAK
jgi:hypothetical protein